MPTYIISNLDDEIVLASNAYLDGSTWKYKVDGFARRFVVQSDKVYSDHAASGSADGTITWVRDLTSTNQGQLSAGQQVSFNNNIVMQILTTAQTVNVGGIFSNSSLSSVGNVGSGEDNLYQHTSVYALLLASGNALVYDFWGLTANNANTKTLRLRFGTTGNNLLFSKVLTPSVTGVWRLQGHMQRIFSNSQQSISTFHENATCDVQNNYSLDQDLGSTTPAFKLTAEAVNDNDVVMKGYRIYWEPQGG